MPSMSPTLISNVSSYGRATTAASSENIYTGITLEPDTVILTPTQFLSTTLDIITVIETASTSTTDASDTLHTNSLTSTLDTSQNVEASTSTRTSVNSSGRYWTSTSMWTTNNTIQTYTLTSASSTSHQPVSMPSSALATSEPSDNIYSPMMIVSMVVAGCFVSVLFMIIVWLLWKRIIWSRRSNAGHANVRNWMPWTTDPQRLSMQRLRNNHLGSFSWEDYHDRADDDSSLFHNNMTSMTTYESGLSNGLFDEQGYHETAEMRRERLDRLARRNHSPNGTIQNSISSWTGLTNRGAISVPEDAPSPRSILKMRLPSILKHNSMSTSANMSIANTHGMTRLGSHTQDDPVRSSTTKAKKVLGWEGSDGLMAIAKKEVRFGETHIKEFGRTPFASTANSVAEDMKDLPNKL